METLRASAAVFSEAGILLIWMDAAMGLSVFDVWQLPTDLTAFPVGQHICHTCHLAGPSLLLPAHSGSQAALISNDIIVVKPWNSPSGSSSR